jgi:Caspase domain
MLKICKRSALVIGNDKYKHDELKCCLNDARLMQKELEFRNFTVTYEENLNYAHMHLDLRDVQSVARSLQYQSGCRRQHMLMYSTSVNGPV